MFLTRILERRTGRQERWWQAVREAVGEKGQGKYPCECEMLKFCFSL